MSWAAPSRTALPRKRRSLDHGAMNTTTPTHAAQTPTSPAPAAQTPAHAVHSAESASPAISVHGIVKAFGPITAVDGIDLEVPRAQIMALLGKNGAGKTTLIDMILGLQTPNDGDAAIFGMSPREAIRRSLVGVVHQTGALPADYTVAQALRMFAAAHERPLPLDLVMAETRLDSLAKRPIRKLSGGEQQRVRLALALLPDPHLLILDEPTAGMDASARREFWALMRLQAERGRTIVFATHYLAEAEDFAERTVIVKDGRVVADGPTAELRRSVARRTLRILLPETSREDARRALAALPGTRGLSVSWTNLEDASGTAELTAAGADTDGAARALLALPGAHDLEIAASSLEDAFTALTA